MVVDQGDVYIVMEYVPGEALSFLRRAAKEARQDIPPAICSAIIVGVLASIAGMLLILGMIGESRPDTKPFDPVGNRNGDGSLKKDLTPK